MRFQEYLRMLEQTSESSGILKDAYELLGIPGNAQDYMWKPQGQLGVLGHSFGCLIIWQSLVCAGARRYALLLRLIAHVALSVPMLHRFCRS